jgi:hypothetical protein
MPAATTPPAVRTAADAQAAVIRFARLFMELMENIPFIVDPELR